MTRDATTDPWEDIEAELLKNIGAPHVQVADLPPDTFVARFFAARAAVERQHAEEIAALRSTVGQQAKQIAQARRTSQFHKDNHLAAEQQVTRLRTALEELHAMVWGECPSLLNEDSGGCGRLDVEIRTLLAPTPEGETR